MGLQEIIAVLLLIAALVFISSRVFFRFKKHKGGADCQSCVSESGITKKSKLKA